MCGGWALVAGSILLRCFCWFGVHLGYILAVDCRCRRLGLQIKPGLVLFGLVRRWRLSPLRSVSRRPLHLVSRSLLLLHYRAIHMHIDYHFHRWCACRRLWRWLGSDCRFSHCRQNLASKFRAVKSYFRMRESLLVTRILLSTWWSPSGTKIVSMPAI